MDAKTWAAVKGVLADAAGLPASEREPYIRQNCHDPALCEGLLDLVANPAALSDLVTQAALAPGTRLGVYVVDTLLGRGGMGEVYRARDAKLGRDVALKVLPTMFAADPERLARLEREARLLAALSHPNIVTIHSVEEADGVLFLTMEYVDGKPLSDLMVKGGLSLTQVLNLAIPLADAISAAHQKSITHRDLKPANVMITVDGRVKVLDFGLAKLAHAPDAVSTDSTTHRITGEGQIIGTISYMSPEQAAGSPLDGRSDVFSLGVILYEMATGERPFKGDNAVSTITSILRDTPPPITAVNGVLPRDLAVIVRRCLVKNPDQRTQSAKDLRNQLEDLQHAMNAGELLAPVAPVASVGGLPRRSRSQWAATGGAVVAAALLAGFGTWMVTAIRRIPETPVITQAARFTHDPGLSEWPTWSPDGKLLAFASNRKGNFDIYVRRVDGGQEVNVTNNASENFQPALSPDGNSIAFVSTRASRTRMIKIGQRVGTLEPRTYGGDVWLVPTLGGQARRLAPDGNFPTWHPSGGKVAYVSGPEGHRSILEVPPEGGTPNTVLPSDSSSWEIVRVEYSPHARWMTFETADNEILIVPLDGGRARRLLIGGGHAWAPSGTQLYYFTRDPGGTTRLQSIAIDERTGTTAGRPATVGLMTGILRDLAVSHNGEQLAVSEAEGSMNLTRLSLNAAGSAPAGPEEVLSEGQVIDGQPSVSPDSRRIAYTSNRLGRNQIWILDVDRRRMDVLQLPGNDVSTEGARWHPDGSRLLALRTVAVGKTSLWWIAADGSYAEELLSPPTLLSNADGWPVAPSGRALVYGASVNGHSQLFDFDLSTRRVRQLTFSSDDKLDAVFSPPDGRWLVYASNANGSSQLWRIPASGGQPEPLTKGNDRVRHMFYSPDGRWLYFQPNHLNIYRMPADGGAVQQVTHFRESGLLLEEPTISPDGRYLVYSRSNGGSSLWVLRLGNTHTQVQ
jgi:Tol biopolymer transport system component